MATRDMFLDALTVAPSNQAPPKRRAPAGSYPYQRDPVTGLSSAQPPQAPTPPAPPVADPAPAPMPEARPEFADDIDRIVRELVSAGDVVFDATLQAYRSPHCRRWRFDAGEFGGNNLSRKF